LVTWLEVLTVTTIVAVAVELAPEAVSVPTVQVTVPEDWVIVPVALEEETYVRPLGRGSDTETAVEDGPLLVSVMVKVSCVPTAGVVEEAVLVMTTFAHGQIASDACAFSETWPEEFGVALD
jgi:hypothetical protein